MEQMVGWVLSFSYFLSSELQTQKWGIKQPLIDYKLKSASFEKSCQISFRKNLSVSGGWEVKVGGVMERKPALVAPSSLILTASVQILTT